MSLITAEQNPVPTKAAEAADPKENLKATQQRQLPNPVIQSKINSCTGKLGINLKLLKFNEQTLIRKGELYHEFETIERQNSG